jgi:protein TonB
VQHGKAGGMMNRLRFVVCMLAPFLFGNKAAHADSDTDRRAAAILDTNQCRPVYPRDAMSRREQGVVTMQFTVGVNGKLVGSAVVKSSGFRDLDQAALNALIRCRFKPAYRDGKPVQAAFVLEYRWELQ